MITTTSQQVRCECLGGGPVSGPEWRPLQVRLTFKLDGKVDGDWQCIFSGIATQVSEKWKSRSEDDDSDTGECVIRFAKDDELLIETYCGADDIDLVAKEVRRIVDATNSQYAARIDRRSKSNAELAFLQKRINELTKNFNA